MTDPLTSRPTEESHELDEPTGSTPAGPAEPQDEPDDSEAIGGWAQPPAPSDGTVAAAGWAQPPGPAPRLLLGATDAREWRHDPELAAIAADETESLPVTAVAPPDVVAPVRTFVPTVERCPRCGGTIDFDGYCEQCGAKAPSVRDHFEAQPAPWVAGVCDRGVRHLHNEDAMALDAAADPVGHAVMVVCDGVSTSTDSDQASLAAARAALAHLTANVDWVLGADDASRISDTVVGAAQAANQAVLDNSDLTSPSPASCTLAIALLSGRQLLSANLGDSRVYFVPDVRPAVLLSTDDSMAQEEIEQGVDRLTAEAGANSHVITRWLGRDAPDTTPSIAVLTVEPELSGWVVACSDGLWNYASEPDAIALLVRHFAESAASDPASVARELVQWANSQGGHDNITVALARVEAEPTPESEQQTIRTRPVGSAAPAMRASGVESTG
ncbi:protein phosphatase 2C domain-containing protein [Brooklawnia cerclae]|uniref:Serine/threonine protein phosphatase PrpC n=1 Tax=Brooklawnia cerclae TaxID=349934 RepID=A0ABX0SCH9_9ACTN|nr:serine/threonine protein phosphatase PrpC [Brooklawnia cerclae]